MSNHSQAPLIPALSREEIERLAGALIDCMRAGTNSSQNIEVVDIRLVDLESLASSVAGITDPIGQIRDWLMGVLQSIAEWIVNSLKGAFQFFVEQILGRLSAVGDALGKAIAGALDAIKSGFANLLERLQSGITWLVQKIGEIGSQLSNFFADLMTFIWTKLTEGLSWLGEQVAKGLSWLLERITEGISRLWDWVQSAVKGLSDIVGRIWQGLQEVGKNILNIITRVGQIIAEAGKNIIDSIINALKGVWDFLSNAFSRVWEGLAKLGGMISEAVRGIIERIAGAIGQVIDFLQGIAGRIVEAVSGFVELIMNALRSVGEALRNAIMGALDFIRGAFSRLWEVLSGIANTIISGVRSFIQTIVDAVMGGLRHLAELIGRVVRTIIDGLSRLIRPVIDAIGRVFDWIRELIGKVIDFIRRGLESVGKLIMRAIQEAGKAIIGAIKSVINTIAETIRGIAGFIQRAIETLGNIVRRVFEEVSKAISNVVKRVTDALAEAGRVLSEAIRGAIGEVIKGLSWLGEKVLEGLKRVGELLSPERLKRVIVDPIVNFFQERIWKPLTKKLGELGDMLSKGMSNILGFFETVGKGFLEIGNIIRNFFTNIVQGFTNLVDAIRGAIDFLQKLVTNPQEALQQLWNAVSQVIDIIVRGLQFIGRKIIEAFAWIGQGLAWLLNIFVEIASKAAEGLARMIAGIASRFVGILTARRSPSVIEILSTEMVPPLTAFLCGPLASGTKIFIPIIRQYVEENFENPIQLLYGIINLAVLGIVAVAFYRRIIRALIASLPEGQARAAPFGLGILLKVDYKKFFSNLWSIIERAAPDVARYLLIGHLIWWAEPTRALTRAWLTKWLTVELPPMEDTLSALRRHLVTPKAGEYYKVFVRQLRMGGIYQGFIERLYPMQDRLVEDVRKVVGDPAKIFDAERGAVLIADRFTPFTGKLRVFPVSLVWAMPSPSDLARMMVRDILEDPRYFVAAMAMQGFHPDAAFLYYLLHYRYPSPEKLAEFFWRGIAGELWLSEIAIDKNVMLAFGLDPEKVKPVPPAALNFQAGTLLDMISWYMKWHDYARFPWRPGWTTDNAIVIELMADIPTKIDLRWMTRWGMFDYWSAHGIGLKEPIGDITKKLLPEGTTCPAKPMVDRYLEMLRSGEIVFDLTQFCRVLQATGIHPYWIPWVAVAESINALTEERTLLRTGFINLYKEGIWTLGDLHTLLSGFFTVKFLVGYFDMAKKAWIPAAIEYPVAFLPAESKLLELRAAMDRALDIYREAYRYIVRAVAYNLIDAKTGRQLLDHIVKAINAGFFSGTIRSLTGKELSLTLDEGYWSAWSVYAETVRHIEAIERTRFYARYIIWSVLWALRLGYTTVEDAERYVDRLIELMHEHTFVHKAVKLAVEFMIKRFDREIAVRAIINLVRSRRISLPEAVLRLKAMGFDEDTARRYIEANVLWYTPSLTTYATLLEVVPEAMEMSLRAIEHFNLPDDEVEYWRLYIFRRPVWDELTLVRTRIYRALQRGVKHEDLVAILRSYMVVPKFKDGAVELELGDRAAKLAEFYRANQRVFQAFGIALHEWVLYNLIAELESLEEAMKGYVPTPSMLATLSEYIVIPKELVDKVLRVRGVPEEWIDLWRRYIEVRPLADDVRGLITAYRRAKVLGLITPELEARVLELARLVGYTDRELSILELRVTIEELIQSARQYIPTPMMLATLSEYIRLPEELVDEALRARRVPERWMTFWKQYIAVRPLADDVRSLLTAYRRAKVLGVLPPELEKRVIDLAKMVGFTERELAVLELRVVIEELIESARQYIPTPPMLATMSEYIVIPEPLVDRALRARRVPEEWVPLWKHYIAIRPLADDIRSLLVAYRRAKVLGVLPQDLESEIRALATKVGWTEKELRILDLRIALEELINRARGYIPTPYMLATMSEYLPEARKFIDDVLRRRNVPEQYWELWRRFVEIRPLINDVRRLVRAAERLYVYFFLKPEDYRKLLDKVRVLGFEDREIELMISASDMVRTYRAFRELIGTPRQLVTMAEYSPRARRLALGQVKKMIDVLPIDQETKEFLKAMWDEFIRVRPVYNEVRRYVTELISDYAEGLIDMNYLKRELEELKEWGLDDAEISFYIKLAEKRRSRYQLREMKRMMRR